LILCISGVPEFFILLPYFIDNKIFKNPPSKADRRVGPAKMLAGCGREFPAMLENHQSACHLIPKEFCLWLDFLMTGKGGRKHIFALIFCYFFIKEKVKRKHYCLGMIKEP